MQRRHHRLHPHEVPSLFVYLPRTAGRMSPLSGARERAVGVDLVFGSWNYSHACLGLRWGVACRMSPLSGARGWAVGVDLVFGSWNYSHACSGCCRATHRHSKTHWLRTLVVMSKPQCCSSLTCHVGPRTCATVLTPPPLAPQGCGGRPEYRRAVVAPTGSPQLLARRRITNARSQLGDGSAQHTGATLPRTLPRKVCERVAPLPARSLTSHEDGPNPRLVLKPSRASFTGHQTMARVLSPG